MLEFFRISTKRFNGFYLHVAYDVYSQKRDSVMLRVLNSCASIIVVQHKFYKKFTAHSQPKLRPFIKQMPEVKLALYPQLKEK